MSIYTRTGDSGTTGLFGGTRVPKYAEQIEAYGSVDELSSFIGIVLRETTSKKEKVLLTSIQKNLYEIMSVLAGAPNIDLTSVEAEIAQFEKQIDNLEDSLPKLHRFILPQGSQLSVWYHVVRTVCRRAERHISVLGGKKSTIPKQSLKICIRYMNRLSDLFYIMARYSNRGKEIVV